MPLLRKHTYSTAIDTTVVTTESTGSRWRNGVQWMLVLSLFSTSIVCMGFCFVFCLSACMCTVCMQCPQRPLNVKSSGTGITESCELPRGCGKLRPCHLEEQPLLQPPVASSLFASGMGNCPSITTLQMIATSSLAERGSQAVWTLSIRCAWVRFPIPVRILSAHGTKINVPTTSWYEFYWLG